MGSVFAFGEQIDEYPVRVLNERAVRAGAGILFFFAIVAFMNAFLLGNFQPTRVFVVAFLVDFGIRIFVNPRYAPSLIVGQWVVRKQQPEYVGAPQKRFAWAIGFVLALGMFYLMVLNNVIGPINMLVCATCLMLMFFETAFGICVGCQVYNLLNKQQAQLCPGGVCEVAPIRAKKGDLAQAAVVIGFVGLVGASASAMPERTKPTAAVAASAPSASADAKAPPASAPAKAASAPSTLDPAEAKRCTVPAFAKLIGHEEEWKLHNNCR